MGRGRASRLALEGVMDLRVNLACKSTEVSVMHVFVPFSFVHV